MKKPLVILLLFLLFTIPVISQEIEDEEEDKDEDRGEDLGVVALGLLGIGSAYVLLRRSFVVSKMLDPEKYKKQRDVILNTYRKLRKPLLRLHIIVLVLATIVGGVHGLLMEESITGMIAWIFMVILSISGGIIYFRFRPIWDNRKSRGTIRSIHRQWVFSAIMLIFLFIHIAD